MRTHPTLDAIAAAGIRLGLWRMREFLHDLGDPHLSVPVLHVGGTNGKGSVSHLLASVLGAAGFRVGLHTSPHLQAVNERIVVGGKAIRDADLDALIREMDAARLTWAGAALEPGDPFPLTYFEFTVACAFRWFATQRCDIAVVEVGMGGRLDATNVVAPEVAAIVTVGLDHTDALGPDFAAIASEKAGILKPGVPAVLGPLPTPALQVVRAVAAERGVPVHAWGEDFDAHGSPREFRFRRGDASLDGLHLAMAGDHQVANAGVAIRVLQALGERRPQFAVGDAAMRAGLAAARNPGRLEWLAPDVLVDGAHNPEGAVALAHFLEGLARDRRRTLVLGGGVDKDVRAVAASLQHVVDRVVVTRSAHDRARPVEGMLAELQGLPLPCAAAPTLPDALRAARNQEDLVVVAGSLYLVGEARDAILGPEAWARTAP